MKPLRIQVADAWLKQAESDLRTAEALRRQPAPMKPGDVACQVLAKLSQSVEKSIKGYVLLSHSEVKHSHRADQYLPVLLDRNLRFAEPAHHAKLATLFGPHEKAIVRQLLDWTPGTLGKSDVPNTEYPWTQKSAGQYQTPYASTVLVQGDDLADYANVCRRIVETLRKLWSERSRRPQPEAKPVRDVETVQPAP